LDRGRKFRQKKKGEKQNEKEDYCSGTGSDCGSGSIRLLRQEGRKDS
jgi:hypothetical protein